MSKCESAYTIDDSLILHCEQDNHRENLIGQKTHSAKYMGVVWTWKDREADK